MNTDKTEIVYNKKEYKYTKEAYLQLKNDIKELSAEQTSLKPQRKADHNLKVERKLAQHLAISKVENNKYILRLLFIVYDEIRSKESKVEDSSLDIYRLKTLKKLRDQYLKETKTLS